MLYRWILTIFFLIAAKPGSRKERSSDRSTVNETFGSYCWGDFLEGVLWINDCYSWGLRAFKNGINIHIQLTVSLESTVYLVLYLEVLWIWNAVSSRINKPHVHLHLETKLWHVQYYDILPLSTAVYKMGMGTWGWGCDHVGTLPSKS